jgi:flagellar hook-associated protein 2
MSTSPLVFTGVSTFSNDFQTVLTRAVAIAKLPEQKLQNEQADNLGRKQALVALNPSVANLAAAIAALGTVAANNGLTASSSDASIVSVQSTGATSAAAYTISNITSLATAGSESSLKGYADAAVTPVSVAGQSKVDLQVGSTTYHLDLTGKNTLNALRDAINNLGAGVNASIVNAGGGNYLALSSSKVGAAALTLTDIAAPVSLITNTGSGTDTSIAAYPDTNTTAVSTSGHVDLTVGTGTTLHLDITAANNLAGLRDAINNAGAGVTASITTNGGNSSLTLASTSGTGALTLNDVPASPNLITKTNQGTDADFYLNGSIHVTKSTNVISDLVAGVTFRIGAKTTGSVNISLASDSAQLSNGLQTFAQTYNAVADQVAGQIGTGGGPLSGDLIIRNISDDLRQLGSYAGNSSSSIKSLSDVGLTFDTTGHLSFDASTIAGLNSSQVADAFKFFGSAKSGFAALASNFTQLSDPLTGFIRLQENGYDQTNARLTTEISDIDNRASVLQKSLSAKLQQADALVAKLQSQQTVLNAQLQSVNFVSYGRVTNSTGQ